MAWAFSSGIIVLMLMVTAEAYVGNSTELSFCTETKECLLYDFKCMTEHYEVRHYSPTKWVSTDEKAFFMEFAALAAFRKLYKYITGSNENGEKMDMTSPVVLKIKKTWSFWWSNVYTLSFLLPSAYQKNPPKPTNSELSFVGIQRIIGGFDLANTDYETHIQVYFTDMPEMNVYVRSFRGWMFSWVMHSHSKQLKEDLEKAKATHEECYFAVGYNSPMTILNRHNEIWYQAIGEPVCVLPGK